MPVDEVDRELDDVCRSIVENDAESDMVQDYALQLLANIGAIDAETRADYVGYLRDMTRGEYDWPEFDDA